MSDGDSATPGPRGSSSGSHGPSDHDGSNQWLTRSPRPSPGAAPWERHAASESEPPAVSESTGNHTDGVTVAYLIARVSGDASVPEELRRNRAESVRELPPPPPPAPVPQPTEIIDAVREEPEPIAPAFAYESGRAYESARADTEIIPLGSLRSFNLPNR